jgi:hypothetical protein
MRRALTRFAQPGQRIGLVMFSDTGYTLLPPGTPGTQLRPLLLFLRPFRQAPHSKKFSLPASPWDEVFRGGTRVSAGLTAAARAFSRHGRAHGAILLMSDLNTLPDDLPRVADAIVRLRAAGIALRIIPLHAAPADRALFERLAGKSAFVPTSSLGRGGLRGTVEAALRKPVPGGLVGAAIALLALLALNELWCGRLLGPRLEPREAS